MKLDPALQIVIDNNLAVIEGLHPPTLPGIPTWFLRSILQAPGEQLAGRMEGGYCGCLSLRLTPQQLVPLIQNKFYGMLKVGYTNKKFASARMTIHVSLLWLKYVHL